MDNLDAQGMHTEEFMAEEPVVLNRPDIDGYVGPDGKPAPHQTPIEVAHMKDDQAELEALVDNIPERDS